MTAEPQQSTDIVAEYTEFTIGSEKVALISDPNNVRAWIKSDRTVPLTD